MYKNKIYRVLSLIFIGVVNSSAMEPDVIRGRIADIKTKLRLEEMLKQLGLIKHSWEELEGRIYADQESRTATWSVRIAEPGSVKSVILLAESSQDNKPQLSLVNAIEIFQEKGKEAEVYYFTDGKYLLGRREKDNKEK